MANLTSASPKIIDEITHSALGEQGTLTDYSLLASLGQLGRTFTYDRDHALELRFSLVQIGSCAVGIYFAYYGGDPNTLGLLIHDESVRAHVKHFENGGSLLDDRINDGQRLGALVEECGEYAEEAAQGKHNRKELIQIANVAASWLTWLDAKAEERRGETSGELAAEPRP